MDGQIIVTGANVLRNPAIGTNSSGGNDGQGTLRIENGQPVFAPDDIVVFDVANVTAAGEVSGASGFVGITVFEDAAAFAAGTPKFTYVPQNPGQQANVQSDLSGLGDGYVRFNANVLISRDPGAPNFNQLIVAGGRDLVSDIQDGPVLFDRN
ncbi:MAG: type I secretion protein, partial [Pseudomonadota bacterium]